MKRSADVPPGLKIAHIVDTEDEDIKVLQLKVYRDGGQNLLFWVCAEDDTIHYCARSLAMLVKQKDSATNDFVAELWELSEHEPTEEDIRGFCVRIDEYIDQQLGR